MSPAAAAVLPAPPKRDADSILLPHNLEAERSTLGAALLYTDAADYIADQLTADAYFRRAHQTVFTAIRELRHNNTAIDYVTIKACLSKKQLDDIGGAVFISQLTDGVPRSTNITYYADILKDLQAKRSLIGFANRTLDLVVDGEHKADTLIADADRRLIELQHGHVDGRLLSLQQTSAALFSNLEWRVAHKGELTGITSGFASIDELTLGWQASDLVVGAARPSIGKTAAVMNMAVQAARSGKRVAVFSLEMRRQQLEYRMVANLAGVALTRLLSGHLGQPDFAKVSAALDVMHALPIHIDDRAGQSAWDIRAACRRLKSEDGLDLVIIDYVQLMPGTLDRRGATRNDEVTDISRRLKALADEVSAPVILLSQLSRKARDRADPRPQLTDLRESGALEQDADIVWFLHRKNHKESGTTNFILEKHRNGPTGTVNLTLDRDTVTFTDGGEDPPEAPKPAAKPAAKPRQPRQHKFSSADDGS